MAASDVREPKWHGCQQCKRTKMAAGAMMLTIMTATIRNNYDDDHKYADDNDETNYEDDVDDSAKYDADDCNVRIIP